MSRTNEKETIVVEGQDYNEKVLIDELTFYRVPKYIQQEIIEANREGKHFKVIKVNRGSYSNFYYKSEFKVDID